MRRKGALVILAFLFSANQLALAAYGRGPKGTLILSGAAGTSRESFGTGVLERFVELAGGPEANFVYIPTASSGASPNAERSRDSQAD